MGIYMIMMASVAVLFIGLGVYIKEKFPITGGVLVLLCVVFIYNYGFDCGGSNDVCSYSEYKDGE